jgi:Tol biopolymer transport system component
VAAFYAEKTTGIVKIETEPASAKIIIEGEGITLTTPAKVNLKKGQYSIKISKDNYKDYSKTVDVEIGTEQSILIKLEKQYLLVSAGRSFYKVSLDLKEKIQIGNNFSDLVIPIEVSPDGQKILYYLGPPRSYDCSLWIMDSDGSQKKNLTKGMNGIPLFASFSSDSKKILFQYISSNSSSIWIMNTDGTQKTNLTMGMGFCSCPSFFSNGNKIVFLKVAKIWIMNTDGSGKQSLTEDVDGNIIFYCISFDENKIAFNCNNKIWIMNTDGSIKRKLTEEMNEFSNQLTFYPEDEKILFESLSSISGITCLWVMNSDGGGQQNLTKDVIGNSWITPLLLRGKTTPFSPDGNKLLFYVSDAEGTLFSWLMNSDGTSKINLGEVLKLDIIDAIWYP